MRAYEDALGYVYERVTKALDELELDEDYDPEEVEA
jgi:hypothetical protein